MGRDPKVPTHRPGGGRGALVENPRRGFDARGAQFFCQIVQIDHHAGITVSSFDPKIDVRHTGILKRCKEGRSNTRFKNAVATTGSYKHQPDRRMGRSSIDNLHLGFTIELRSDKR